MTRLALCIGLAALAATGAAQPHNQDLLIGSDGLIARMTPGGHVTTVTTLPNETVSELAMDTDNRHVVALLTQQGGPPHKIIRVDPRTGIVVTTIWSGAPLGGWPAGLQVDQDGDYVVAHFFPQSPYGSRLVKVDRGGASITTLYSSYVSWFTAFVEDRTRGDWVVAEAHGKCLIKIDRDRGGIRSSARIDGNSIVDMGQDPRWANIYVGSSDTDTIYLYDPIRNAVATLTTYLPTKAMTVDRAPAKDRTMLFVAGSGKVYKVGFNGSKLGTVGSAGFGVEALTIDRSRNVASRLDRAPNDRRILLSFPGDGGSLYIFAVTLAGYTPGIGLPDNRVVPLNPDPLFLTTVHGEVRPLLTNNIGVLDASGGAVVRFNLNALGPAVKGLRVWGAAVALNGSAPLGVSQISAPILFVL